jgi:hypothetical protein
MGTPRGNITTTTTNGQTFRCVYRQTDRTKTPVHHRVVLKADSIDSFREGGRGVGKPCGHPTRTTYFEILSTWELFWWRMKQVKRTIAALISLEIDDVSLWGPVHPSEKK